MSAGDIAEVLGYLLASWVVGYGVGYVLTTFRRAMDAVS